ncbi:MAG: DUF3786 domain-containing protein [Thermodesulfobacteriota bacterium]
MTGEQPALPEQNELYRGLERLPAALWQDLGALDPGPVRHKAGVAFDRDRGYIVPFLGTDHLVRPWERTITVRPGGPRPGFQSGLVVLKYLLHASDEGLAGRMVTARELPGGDLFFTGPHALSTSPVEETFSRNAAGLLAAAQLLDAAPLAAGDAAFRLLALPKILVNYTFYQADDEFPARLTITFDAAAHRHLPLDCLWALINVLSHRLAESGRK